MCTISSIYLLNPSFFPDPIVRDVFHWGLSFEHHLATVSFRQFPNMPLKKMLSDYVYFVFSTELKAEEWHIFAKKKKNRGRRPWILLASWTDFKSRDDTGSLPHENIWLLFPIITLNCLRHQMVSVMFNVNEVTVKFAMVDFTSWW